MQVEIFERAYQLELGLRYTFWQLGLFYQWICIVIVAPDSFDDFAILQFVFVFLLVVFAVADWMMGVSK